MSIKKSLFANWQRAMNRAAECIHLLTAIVCESLCAFQNFSDLPALSDMLAGAWKGSLPHSPFLA